MSREFRATMLADRSTSLRAAIVIAFCATAACAQAQTASSASFSLESTLLTGAAHATSANFSAEICVSPGMGGVSSSTSFSLTTGCGAMMTLSSAEASALGLVVAVPDPVVVPALSALARVTLPVLMMLAGWIAIRYRRGHQPRKPLGRGHTST